MPEIQELYEKYDQNEEDLVVLGVATPNLGREGSAEDIAKFLKDQGYTFPTVMDDTGFISAMYGISAYPTTFMIDVNGNVYGYVGERPYWRYHGKHRPTDNGLRDHGNSRRYSIIKSVVFPLIFQKEKQRFFLI